ncbi:hypothetical protein MKY25_11300 [Geobacillus sp. FSL W8-0032]|uniref:hypothetical protein n=1 Tax=Geobacillus sp. FSL W8-0032 TaxID=2921730 RepID=UPI0031591828
MSKAQPTDKEESVSPLLGTLFFSAKIAFRRVVMFASAGKNMFRRHVVGKKAEFFWLREGQPCSRCFRTDGHDTADKGGRFSTGGAVSGQRIGSTFPREDGRSLPVRLRMC